MSAPSLPQPAAYQPLTSAQRRGFWAATKTGMFLGTIHYASPEQINDGRVDSRSDLYGLGVLLYHALAGRLPFTGMTLVEVIQQIRTAAPERPTRFQPTLPADFEGAVLQLLAKRPETRIQLLVITADRGLATALSQNAMR